MAASPFTTAGLRRPAATPPVLPRPFGSSMMSPARAIVFTMCLRLVLPVLFVSLLTAGQVHAFTQADLHTPLSASVAGPFVVLHGRIVPGSVDVVRAALDRAGPGRPVVLVDSPGGSISPALTIGRLVRARGLRVAVARLTEGQPTDVEARCASACVLVLAGGVTRNVGPAAAVGVHRLVDWTTYSRTWDVYRVLRRRGVIVGRQLISRQVLSRREVYTDAPPRDYAAVRRYLGEMGEASALVVLMRSTPAMRLHWMTSNELSATRIATDRQSPGATGKVRRVGDRG